MTLAPEVLATDGDLATLRAEWLQLWREVPAATPFQSPDWLLPWWRHFGTGEPRVVVLRDHARKLAGVLPFYILDEAPAGKKLLPIGAGITDYQDALLRPGLGAKALLRALLDAGATDGVTSCDLIDVPPEAALRRECAALPWQHADACPVLPIPAHAKDLADVIHATASRNCRLNRNRLHRLGSCVVEAATETTLAGCLDELFRLHEARWDENGVLRDEKVRAFHRDAAPLLLARGTLRLLLLRLDGVAVAAMEMLVAGGGRLLCYLSGYDRRLSREGPGSVLLGAAIEEAIGEGFSEIHFLRGGERYKYEWGGVDRFNATCRLPPT